MPAPGGCDHEEDANREHPRLHLHEKGGAAPRRAHKRFVFPLAMPSCRYSRAVAPRSVPKASARSGV